ncbi:MAG: hypothetical protein WC302_00025 [Candidatus Paceibacterota bacterium]|jgi:hypothetical protein
MKAIAFKTWKALSMDYWPVLEMILIVVLMIVALNGHQVREGGWVILAIFLFAYLDYCFIGLRQDYPGWEVPTKGVHHWLTIPAAVVIFFWAICSLTEWSFLERLKMDFTSNVVLLVYIPVRGLRGLYRHWQNSKVH